MLTESSVTARCSIQKPAGTVPTQHERNQAGGVLGAEAAKGSRSRASSEVEDVAGVDRSLCDGDVGSSKTGRRASSSTASEVSGVD